MRIRNVPTTILWLKGMVEWLHKEISLTQEDILFLKDIKVTYITDNAIGNSCNTTISICLKRIKMYTQRIKDYESKVAELKEVIEAYKTDFDRGAYYDKNTGAMFDEEEKRITPMEAFNPYRIRQLF